MPIPIDYELKDFGIVKFNCTGAQIIYLNSYRFSQTLAVDRSRSKESGGRGRKAFTP